MQISSAKSSRRGSRLGYTLIELVVVLLIIALTTAMIAPRLVLSDTARMNRLQAEIEAVVSQARASAMRSGRESLLIVDTREDVLRVEPSGQSLDLAALDGLEAVVAESELDGNLAGIRFFPDGGATGGRLDMRIGEVERSVMIDWLTGRTSDVEPDA